jgi:EpsI family protein
VKGRSFAPFLAQHQKLMTRLTNLPATRAAIAAVLLVFCYAGLLTTLFEVWMNNSRYSYGIAVPLISGYVIWTRWPQFKSAVSAPDYRMGVPLVLVAMLMLVVGRVGALMALEGLSLIVAVTGTVALLAGRSGLRAVWFPVAYLVLMLPIWDHAINLFQGPSQEFAASMATHLLRLSGLAAFQQGTTITLATVTLEVMPECSGINQLIALSTMALPAAYLWIQTRTRQAALLAIAVVVGYVSNGLRVALLGWLTVAGVNVKDGHSFLHLAPGFLTAAIAYGILGISFSWLARRSKGSAETQAIDAVPATRAQAEYRPMLEVAVAVIVLAAGTLQLVGSPVTEVRTQALSLLPSEIAGWSLESSDATAAAHFPGFDVDLLHVYENATSQLRFPSVDEEILRTYRNAAGRRVQVYVGYYGQQRDGKELAGDLSQSLQRRSSPVDLAVGSERFALKQVVQQTDTRQRGVVFWYYVNGRVVSNIYLAKGYTLLDAFTRRRTNGAAVIIAWDALNGLDSAREDAIAFAQQLLPLLRDKLPS